MNLWFRESFTIETRTSIPRLMEELLLHIDVEPRHGLSWLVHWTNKPFEGQVSEEGFTISRVIWYRNAFRPVLSGRFVPVLSGTWIEVQMHLSKGALFLLLMWIGYPLLLLCGALMARQPEGVALLSGILLLAWIVTAPCFWIEARIARKRLEQILSEREAEGECEI